MHCILLLGVPVLLLKKSICDNIYVIIYKSNITIYISFLYSNAYFLVCNDAEVCVCILFRTLVGCICLLLGRVVQVYCAIEPGWSRLKHVSSPTHNSLLLFFSSNLRRFNCYGYWPPIFGSKSKYRLPEIPDNPSQTSRSYLFIRPFRHISEKSRIISI